MDRTTLSTPLRKILDGLGSIATFGQSAAKISRVLFLLSPVYLAIFGSKLAKLALYRPMLPSDVSGREGALSTALLLRLAPDSTVVHVLALFFALFIVQRLAFRTRSVWWVPSIVGGAFLLGRVWAGFHTGQWSFTDSYTLQHLAIESGYVYALFREDILACLLLSWVSVGFCAVFVPRKQLPGKVVMAWITVPALLLLSLDLASFYKTGIFGTAQMLSFLIENARGSWFLLRDETDFTVALWFVCPLAGLVLLPGLLERVWPVANGARMSWRKGAALVGSTVFLTVIPAPPLPPEYARFANNSYFELSRDLLSRRNASSEIVSKASRGSLLFDARFTTAAAAPPHRNVVLIMLESVRASATGLYDPALENTPFLRELATRGAMIDEMYAVEPRTSAAWIALMQGIYPGDSDAFFYWEQLESRRHRAVSLPRLLARYNYNTAFFLTTHLHLQNDQQVVNNLGFDLVVHDSDPQPANVAYALDHLRFEKVNYFGMEDRVLLTPIAHWLDANQPKAQPFFMALMTNVGHYPYAPPKSWPIRQYTSSQLPQYNEYLNSIAYIDSYLRDVFALFEKRGLMQSTVFVVLGDHGESFGEHGPRLHFGQAYEEVLRIPGILYAPGLVAPGTRITGLRQQIDVMPTVLDLLGLKLTSGAMPGRSLLTAPDAKRKLYFSGVYEDSTLGRRDGDTKVLFNFGRTATEIFDLKSDPGERRNLASSLSAPEIKALEDDILLWRESVNRALFTGVTAAR